MTWVWIFALVIVINGQVVQREDDATVVVHTKTDVGYFSTLEECLAMGMQLARGLEIGHPACERRHNV